jgi:hypothetical protein
MFHEYPKCLYLGGEVEAKTRVVFDSDEEKQAGADGFVNLGKSQEKAKPEPIATEPKRRGRPPKGE